MSEVSNEPRYFLHAFVCEDGCVEHRDNLGWMTFTQIVGKREWGCRYAVVQTEKHEVEVWDLYHDEWLMSGKYPPPPEGVYADADQAIMATALVYRQGDK